MARPRGESLPAPDKHAPKTVLIISSFAESLIGFRAHLIREMVFRGNVVHASAPDFSPEQAAVLAALGVVTHAVPMDRTGRNPARDFLYFARMTRLCRRLRPDMCLAYTIKPVTLGLPAARLAGVRERYALITGLGYAFTAGSGGGWLGKLVRRMYQFALAGARHVFFQNPDDRDVFKQDDLIGAGTGVSVVRGSGVDLDHFTPREFPAAPVSFLMIARLLGDKGVREYAAAASELKAEFPEVAFRLAGWLDINPSAITPAELADWEEKGTINYLGRLDDVRNALGEATVFVLPSYREGTPRTVLEAMATARAVVTTDVPGCRETVVDGVNGYLVEVRSPSSLAAAMRRLINDPSSARTMGQAARRFAEQHYNVHDVNRTMLEKMHL